MKRILTCAIATVATLMVAGTTSSFAQTDVLSSIKSKGTLTCGVLAVNEPFAYQDVQTRQLVGYELDLCTMLGDYLGVKSEKKVVTSQSRVPELVQGRVDVLISLLSYTTERAEQVDFSNNYLEASWKCVVQKDSPIQHLNELSDKRVAVLKGSVVETPFRKKFPDATILALDDTSASLLALFQGKVAATCNNVVTVRLVASQSGDGDNTRVLPEPIMTATTGMAVKKGNTAFVEQINTFLDKIETDGQGDKLFNKWLGSDSKLKLTRDFKFGTPNRPLQIN